MASQVQYRRGTNAQNAAFTGALGEITVDTTSGTLRVHDAITVGGSNIATVSYVTSQISALSANSISSGTSNVRVVSSGGNVTTSVGGTSNVMVVSSTDVTITGNLTVTGNATLSGNILGDRIQNGTTQIDIQTPGGNANITVGGTSNVAVFATTGEYVTIESDLVNNSPLGSTFNISSYSANCAQDIQNQFWNPQVIQGQYNFVMKRSNGSLYPASTGNDTVALIIEFNSPDEII
jgi:hypothetical protein